MVASSRSSGARSSQLTPETPASEVSEKSSSQGSEGLVTSIEAKGDLILKIQHETPTANLSHCFRVHSPVLKKTSKYFERLLQPGRFEEANSVKATHDRLRAEYGAVEKAPEEELPVLHIAELGRISSVKAIDALLTDFLGVLHDKEIQGSPPVGNLANLAVVADRFDAIDTVKLYVKRKKLIRGIDGKTVPKTEAALPEEKVRQRLLVALLLDYPPWVERYSLRLIARCWVGMEADLASALWWDLPQRVEEDLAFRRERVLETMQAVQSHFLAMYTSRERQCKLGYDSSPQCDSFQLGEMIRFFSRIGTLRLQCTLVDTAGPSVPYEGDLFGLIDSFRQVPEYQIDKFHNHCGIRTKITPLLDLLHDCVLHVGVCAECWQNDRQTYAWVDAKPPLLWKRQTFRLRGQSCASKHAGLRELFMAGDRDWAL